MKKTQQGLSLIEVVVAIVILAIIGGLALPKYLDMVKEARIARLEGLAGIMRTGAKLVNVEAKLRGVTADEEQVLNFQGVDIRVWSGHAIGHWNLAVRYMLTLDEIGFTQSRSEPCEDLWCGKGNHRGNLHGLNVQPGRISKIFPEGSSWNDECGVYYINREDGDVPEIGILTADC